MLTVAESYFESDDFRWDVILHAAFIAGAWTYLQQIHFHLTLPKLIV